MIYRRCCEVLHGVLWWYTLLQGVTRFYKVLHRVSWCNTVFHGVTRTIASIRQDEAVALSRFWPFSLKKRLIEKITPRKKLDWLR